MPLYEYACSKGHKTERVVISINAPGEPLPRIPCEHKRCKEAAELMPSQTGTPILKRGIGGFYKPNAP